MPVSYVGSGSEEERVEGVTFCCEGGGLGKGSGRRVGKE